MIMTTLCYIENNNKYLMLYRNKKKHDINKGKYIGLGGHIEEGEDPLECVCRECFEESGLNIENVILRGILTFAFDGKSEICFLYTAFSAKTDVTTTSEGELSWVDKNKVKDLILFEGDKYFLDLLDSEKVFNMKLVYHKENLERVILNGVKIK